MLDENNIYQEHILDHWESPYNKGSCRGVTHIDEGNNPLCGDVIKIELKISPDNIIEEAWFGGDGCCISQSSASMLMEKIEGKTVDEIKSFTANDMLELFGAKLTPNRQKCCLLSWRVLQSSFYSTLDRGNDTNEPD